LACRHGVLVERHAVHHAHTPSLTHSRCTKQLHYYRHRASPWPRTLSACCRTPQPVAGQLSCSSACTKSSSSGPTLHSEITSKLSVDTTGMRVVCREKWQPGASLAHECAGALPSPLSTAKRVSRLAQLGMHHELQQRRLAVAPLEVRQLLGRQRPGQRSNINPQPWERNAV